jgi:surface polysaccharide O-acyltransferase-like enzyme
MRRSSYGHNNFPVSFLGRATVTAISLSLVLVALLPYVQHPTGPVISRRLFSFYFIVLLYLIIVNSFREAVPLTQ